MAEDDYREYVFQLFAILGQRLMMNHAAPQFGVANIRAARLTIACHVEISQPVLEDAKLAGHVKIHDAQ